MPNSFTYTAKAKLAKPALDNTGWDSSLNGDFDQLDGFAAIGGLAVSFAEVPSASLNVAVAAGAWQAADGAVGSYAGVSSQAVTASQTNYLYLDPTGALVVNTTGFPSTGHVPLATVLAGASTLTSVTDARKPFRAVGRPAVAAKTTTYTITDADRYVLGDTTAGAFTITLPTVVARVGKVFTVKQINSANALTLKGNGAELIDQANTILYAARGESHTVVSDGVQWWTS